MATTRIPLKCTICPKNPNFSDVSHLLTHVASKGHLSHYYKVKVRAGNDLASREVIDNYDAWYAQWGVEKLMSERMHVKDRRRSGKSRAQGQANNVDVCQPSTSHQRAVIASSTTIVPLSVSAHPQNQSQIDPQLEEPTTNEHALYPSCAPFLNHNDGLSKATPAQTSQKHRPRLHLWSTSQPTSLETVPLGQSSPVRRTPPLFGLPSIERRAPTAYMGGMLGDAIQLNNEDGLDLEVGDDIFNDSTKLKGVLWPGMDIFDAATPTMKRMRNQKKDTSVVELLEQSSLQVEATEKIFTPNGSLKKERPISGQVELDSSPYKLDIPSPPKRRTSSRRILAEKDPNITSNTGPQQDSFSKYYAPAKDPLDVDCQVFASASRVKKKKQRRDFVVFQDLDTENEDLFIQSTSTTYPAAASESYNRQMSHADRSIYPPAPTSLYYTEAHQPLFGQSSTGGIPGNSEIGADPFYSLESLNDTAFNLPYYGFDDFCPNEPASIYDFPLLFPPRASNPPLPLVGSPSLANNGQLDLASVKNEVDDSETIAFDSDQ